MRSFICWSDENYKIVFWKSSCCSHLLRLLPLFMWIFWYSASTKPSGRLSKYHIGRVRCLVRRNVSWAFHFALRFDMFCLRVLVCVCVCVSVRACRHLPFDCLDLSFISSHTTNFTRHCGAVLWRRRGSSGRRHVASLRRLLSSTILL